MAPASGPDPLELRVLSALTAGASTAMGVAAEVGQPTGVVEPLLERAVAEQTVTRLELPGMPTYALTTKGHSLLGDALGEPGAVDEVGQDDESRITLPTTAAWEPEGASEPVVELPPVPPTGVAPVPGSGAARDPIDSPPATVRWRHVVYAVGYVVLGLLLLFVAPVLGGLAVLAGLVIGGFTLRPLFAAKRVSRR